MKTITLTICGTLLLLVAACKKSGELQQESGLMRANISSYWSDQDIIAEVRINNTLVMDSMTYSRSSANNKIVDRSSGKQNLTIRNLVNKEVLLDTLLDVPYMFLDIVLLQLQKGALPVIVNKEEKSTATRKLGFVFTDPEFPETMILEFYSLKMKTPLVVESGLEAPVQVFENLRRGSFTGFMEVPLNKLQDLRWMFKLKDAATGAYLPWADKLDPPKNLGGRLNYSTTEWNRANNHILDIRRSAQAGGRVNYTSNKIVNY